MCEQGTRESFREVSDPCEGPVGFGPLDLWVLDAPA